MCDGQEVNRSTYANLYATIGLQYGTPKSTAVFKLSDLRGRQVTGKDNMGGTSADRVTDAVADSLGGFGGAEEKLIAKEQLPDHEHDLRSDSADQFYVTRNVADASQIQKYPSNGSQVSTQHKHWQHQGGVTGTFAQSFNVMDPFLTMNYITTQEQHHSMSYKLNKTDGTILTDLVDGTIDTTRSDLTLIGRNYSGFGEFLNENFIKLLENFSSADEIIQSLEVNYGMTHPKTN